MKAFFTHYASISGRASRMEFLGVNLWALILAVAFALASSVFFPPFEGLFFLLALEILMLPPIFSVYVRRLHDMNRSGHWLWLWLLLPAILFLWLLFARGTAGENRFDSAKFSLSRRLWKVGVLFVVFGLAFLIVSAQISTFIPAEVTKETHGLTEPKFPDGKVDYGAAFMRRHAACFEIPEQNGFRILAEEFGPAIFCGLCDFASLSQEHLQEPSWLKTCEKLGLAPDLKPNWPEVNFARTVELCQEGLERKLQEKAVSASLKKEWEDEGEAAAEMESSPGTEAGKEEKEQKEESNQNQTEEKIAEQEEALRLFQTLNPLLDRIVEAAEKPYLMPWCVKEEKEVTSVSGLSEIKTLSKALAIRASLRLESGETESALRDLKAIFRLGNHVGKRGDCVSVLAQGGIEWNGHVIFWEALLSEKVTLTQLEQFRETFQELSERVTFQEVFETEMLEAYRLFQWYVSSGGSALQILGGSDSAVEELSWRAKLRKRFHWWKSEMDENAARHVLRELLEPFRTAALESNPILRRKMLSEAVSAIETDVLEDAALRMMFGLFSAKGRAEIFTQMFTCLVIPIYAMMDDCMNSGNARFQMAQIALEAEIFHRRNGKYPETLEELKLPKELLTDPFSGEKTFEYCLNPETPESWQKRFDAWLVRQFRFPEWYKPIPMENFKQGEFIPAEEISENLETVERPELTEEEILHDVEFESDPVWLCRPFFLYSSEEAEKYGSRKLF